ncbi:MAG: nitrate reductase molybdenum cofactor assembly chaperone [Gammaproteobacteria bacterium]|nr:nitrate reductase molybdenum cofactor assembly chaperone [Gammaproteobacteria bacterium]
MTNPEEMAPMDIVKVIAVLLHYPQAEVQAAAAELRDAITAAPDLPAAERVALTTFLARLEEGDLLDLQAEYVATFDRGRRLSLHLFEHIHGESRDRGQAMVDLLAHYRAAGLEPAVSELPDYLPLFLEYCSLLPAQAAREWLEGVGELLALLHARLQRRASPYAPLFPPLLRLAGVDRERVLEAIAREVAGESDDATPGALDRDWQEGPVTFGPDAAAGCTPGRPAGGASGTQWVAPPRAL